MLAVLPLFDNIWYELKLVFRSYGHRSNAMLKASELLPKVSAPGSVLPCSCSPTHHRVCSSMISFALFILF
jgi:hypothetical protein